MLPRKALRRMRSSPLSRKSPDNLIAMCTHGRSGVKRWMLGSVTETVVRHSADPVLVLRAS